MRSAVAVDSVLLRKIEATVLVLIVVSVSVFWGEVKISCEKKLLTALYVYNLGYDSPSDTF